MRRVDDGVLQDFIAHQVAELRRAAYLMCGDWEQAEEAATRALAAVVASGGRGGVEHLDERAWRALMAQFHHDRRRARRERIFTATPGHDPAPGDPDDPVVTIAVLAALRELPPRSQAVLVLSCRERFGAGYTADALGISAHAARSRAARGLAALHERLRGLASAAPTAAGDGP